MASTSFATAARTASLSPWSASAALARSLATRESPWRGSRSDESHTAAEDFGRRSSQAAQFVCLAHWLLGRLIVKAVCADGFWLC